MIRAHILKKNKYSKKYKHAEDYDLWFKIAAQYKLANIPEFLTYYRAPETGTSKQNNNHQREQIAELLSAQLDELEIEYSSEELTVHLAIFFGYGQGYFNTPKKIVAAKKWVNKVLTTGKKHPVSNVRNMQQYIIENYCGIYS